MVPLSQKSFHDTPIPCPRSTGTNSVTGKSALNQCLVNSGYYRLCKVF